MRHSALMQRLRCPRAIEWRPPPSTTNLVMAARAKLRCLVLMMNVHDIESHVVPLFFSQNQRPRACGSGFLLALGMDTYLISAAHVLAHMRKGLRIGFFDGARLRELQGTVAIAHVPGSDIDIGAVRLDGGCSGSKQPMEAGLLVPENLNRAGHLYLLSGYPGSCSKYHAVRRQQEFQLALYRTPIGSDEQYAALGRNLAHHIVMPLDRERTRINGIPRHFRHPGEMSGSPVWRVGPGPEPQVLSLAGVFTEYHKNRRLLVATDIAFVLSMLTSTEFKC
jgi:hypothetical protein